jgi:hypothetical protein
MKRFVNFLKDLPWQEIWKTISLWRGSNIGRGGTFCLIAGVGTLTGYWQYIIVGVLKYKEVPVEIPESPLWLTTSIGLFLILLGVFLLLWNVRQETKREPDPTNHDVDLYRKFRALITNNDLTFLRETNFGNTFSWSQLDHVAELIDDWRGARYEFNDPEVQQVFDGVIQAARDFNNEISVKAHSTGRGDQATIDVWHMPEMETPPEFFDTTQKLNSLSRNLFIAINEFEQISTARLYRS